MDKTLDKKNRPYPKKASMGQQVLKEVKWPLKFKA